MARKATFTRRGFLRSAAAGATGILLASCAPTPQVVEKKETVVQEVEKIVTVTPGPAAPVTIRFPQAMGDDGQPVFEEVAKWFTEKHPNVTVKVDPTFDWDFQKYLVQAAAGTAPDILWGDEHWSFLLAAKGVELDLNPFIEASGFKKDDYADLYEYFTMQGKLYSLAIWYGCEALFFNQTAFEKAELQLPNDKWTYDDMLAAAKKLTVDSNGDEQPEQWGAQVETSWANPWGSVIGAFGGQFFNADGTEFLICKKPNYDGLQWYIDLIHKWKVAPTPEISEALAGGGDPFQVGSVAMKFAAAWSLVTYRKITDFVWDCAPMPLGPKGRSAALTTDSLSIYRGTKYPDESWAFVVELLSSKAGKLYCEKFAGPLPIVKTARDCWLKPDLPPKNQQLFLDAIDYAAPPMQSPYSYVVEEIFYQEMTSATDGTKTVDEAMAACCDTINQLLAEEVEKLQSYGST